MTIIPENHLPYECFKATVERAYKSKYDGLAKAYQQILNLMSSNPGIP